MPETSSTTGFRQGVIAGISCVAFGLAVTIFGAHQTPLRLLSLLVVPFTVGVVLSGSALAALTLTWANEILAGGTGSWITVGPISGRWLLLIFTLACFAIRVAAAPPRRAVTVSHRTRTVSTWVFLLGGVYPLWLLLYAWLGRAVPLGMALRDLTFFVAILMYFPIRSARPRDRQLLIGWVLGGIAVLVCLFLAMAFGSAHFATAVYNALSPGSTFGTAANGINRAVLLPISLVPLPIFICVLYVVRTTVSLRRKLVAGLLGIACLLPMLVTWVRGPLVAIVLVLLLLAVAMARGHGTQRPRVRLWALIFLVVIGGLLTIRAAVPQAFHEQFQGRQSGLASAWLDSVRVDEARTMFDAFKKQPIFGQGVGTPVPGAPRAADPLTAELEYNTLLYRLGLLGLLALVPPLVWFFREPFRIFRSAGVTLENSSTRLLLATLATTLAIFIMGAADPYLRTPYAALMIVLYLSMAAASEARALVPRLGQA